jgi:hypothetical protein
MIDLWIAIGGGFIAAGMTETEAVGLIEDQNPGLLPDEIRVERVTLGRAIEC